MKITIWVEGADEKDLSVLRISMRQQFEDVLKAEAGLRSMVEEYYRLSPMLIEEDHDCKMVGGTEVMDGCAHPSHVER